MTEFKTIECLEGANYIPKNIMVTGGAGTFQSGAEFRPVRRGLRFFSLPRLLLAVLYLVDWILRDRSSVALLGLWSLSLESCSEVSLRVLPRAKILGGPVVQYVLVGVSSLNV